MAKNQATSRIGGRVVLKIAAVAAVFVLGAIFGGSLTSGDKADDQRQQIMTCLPVADAAALDTCLGGAA